MDNKAPTPRQIDNLLTKILASVRGDVTSLVYVEHVILVLHYCIENLPESQYQTYIRLNSYSIMAALTIDSIDGLNYETLKALPGLVRVIERIEPESLPENIHKIKGAIDGRLIYYEYLLGDRKYDELSEDSRSEVETRYSSSTNEVKFLVVSKVTSAENGQFNVGKVLTARLDIDILGEGSLFNTSEASITFEKRVRHEEDTFSIQLEKAVRIAEAYNSGKRQKAELARLPRAFRFSTACNGSAKEWSGVFTGGSAGLSFAVLARAALDDLHIGSSQRRIRNNVAITGMVDDDGNILAVDDKDIHLKTRAVFYSQCEYMVLPVENTAAASEELSRLSRDYPAKKMEMIPVSNLKQVFSDPRIIDRIKVPAIKSFASRTRLWKKHLVSAAAVAVAVVLMAVLIPPRTAREYVRHEFDGERIIFYNKYDYDFKEYPVGYNIVNVPSDAEKYGSKSHKIYSEDITGDGKKDLLFLSVESDSGATKPAGRIHAHLFSNAAELIRHITLWDSLTISRGNYRKVFSDFAFYHSGICDFDGDGWKEVVLAATDIEFYPSVLYNISFLDSTYQSFVHAGHMNRFVISDFNKDGKEEIALAGFNNGLETPVVAVLDPMNMHGMTPDYGLKINGEKLNNVAKYYFRIPTSGLCKVMEGCNCPLVNDITIGPDDNLKFGVGEFTPSDKQLSLFYRMDGSMRCYEIEFTDPYRYKYSEIFGVSGIELSHKLDLERDALANGFKYLNGDNFSDKPVISSDYLELIKRKND